MPQVSTTCLIRSAVFVVIETACTVSGCGNVGTSSEDYDVEGGVDLVPMANKRVSYVSRRLGDPTSNGQIASWSGEVFIV